MKNLLLFVLSLAPVYGIAGEHSGGGLGRVLPGWEGGETGLLIIGNSDYDRLKIRLDRGLPVKIPNFDSYAIKSDSGIFTLETGERVLPLEEWSKLKDGATAESEEYDTQGNAERE